MESKIHSLQNIQAIIKSDLKNLNERMNWIHSVSLMQDPKKENKILTLQLRDMIKELQQLTKNLVILSQYSEEFQQKAQVLVPDIKYNQDLINEQQHKLENNLPSLTPFLKLYQNPDYPGSHIPFLGNNNSIETLLSLEKDPQTIQNNDQLSYQIDEQIYHLQNNNNSQKNVEDLFQEKVLQLQDQKSKINMDIEKNLETIKSSFQNQNITSTLNLSNQPTQQHLNTSNNNINNNQQQQSPSKQNLNEFEVEEIVVENSNNNNNTQKQEQQEQPQQQSQQEMEQEPNLQQYQQQQIVDPQLQQQQQQQQQQLQQQQKQEDRYSNQNIESKSIEQQQHSQQEFNNPEQQQNNPQNLQQQYNQENQQQQQDQQLENNSNINNNNNINDNNNNDINNNDFFQEQDDTNLQQQQQQNMEPEIPQPEQNPQQDDDEDDDESDGFF